MDWRKDVHCELESLNFSSVLSAISAHAEQTDHLSINIDKTESGYRLSMHSVEGEEPSVTS